MPGGDLAQNAPAGRVRGGEPIMAEGAVTNDRRAVFHAPRNDGVLDGALLQTIEHLVARGMAGAGDGAHFAQIVDVKVADAQARILPAARSCSKAAMVSGSGWRPRQ